MVLLFFFCMWYYILQRIDLVGREGTVSQSQRPVSRGARWFGHHTVGRMCVTRFRARSRPPAPSGLGLSPGARLSVEPLSHPCSVSQPLRYLGLRALRVGCFLPLVVGSDLMDC